jgi:CBS domain-containing protein
MKTLREIIRGKALHFTEVEKTVLEVSQLMSEHNVGALPVLAGSRLAGIFSERDIMSRCVAKGLDPSATKVEDVMTKKVIVMEADDTYDYCLRIMKQRRIRHIPVREGDKLIGMVSMRDLMQSDAEAKEEEIEVLHSYIHYFPGVAKEG